MILRRTLLVRLAAGPMALRGARAQTAVQVPRVGLLLPERGGEPGPRHRPLLASFVDALRRLGWIDGKTLIIDVRQAGTDPQRQREVAAELKALQAAVIVAPGTITVRAARDGAPGVPVVMVNAGDPVGTGLVASLARPGGNLTGTSAVGEEVLAKQVELLASAAPRIKRVTLLVNRVNPANGFFFDAAAARARALGLQLTQIDIATEGEIDSAIERARGGALLVLGDPMFTRHRARIVAATLRDRVPAIFGGRDFVAEGGLMSYLSDFNWHWRSAADFVDKILRGARPGDLPVAQPTQFELVINARTAKVLGLTIPQSLLLRADEVIE